MILRPYQQEAVRAVEDGWNEHKRQLLVLPTGTGKTVVFSRIAQDRTDRGRVLILAHRDELIEQARDKYLKLTGDQAGKIKGSETCLMPVTVGSVQTMMRRVERFPSDYFKTVIVDEAHHSLADSYQKILTHFDADVLGVTATPDRGDKKSLGRYYDNLSYEYSLRQAVQDGYLCQLRARTIPLRIDMSRVKVRVGDFEVNSIAETLEPYLPEIADVVRTCAADRKTVIFCPLISIAQELASMIPGAREVNGSSPDRKETLEWFDQAGSGAVLCNAMLLTEGWDCPSVDCVVVLRPTKIRALYCQMIGRGTRPAPGKKDLLILDFLWMTQKHDLCKPADLSVDNEEDRQYVTKKSTDEEIDLFGAASDAVEARRRKLAEELAAQANKKAKLIDPLTWFVNINDMDLADYEPSFRWEMDEPSEKQVRLIESCGLDTTDLTKGKASLIIDRIMNRRRQGLATPKQIKTLVRFGYQDVGTWSFDRASKQIDELSKNGWRRR
ncbi:MAG: DEAD/DEAH box helicase [Ruminococcus sp.]|nr:DEAD/DEAH box helicase [Ruminococcus sp.]